MIVCFRNLNLAVAFKIFLVPRRTLICERILKDLGVFNDVKLGEYPLDLIPFDYDLLSMEIGSGFKECFLEGDLSSLYYVAKCLMKIQGLYGVFPHIKVAGSSGNAVLEMMMRMKKNLDDNGTSPEIDTLILFDRRVDLITPLFTQLTYEGLIDELFSIKNGCFQPKFDCVPGGNKDNRPKVLLNSNDTIFSEIRDLNLAFVGHTIKKRSVMIEEEINEKNSLTTVPQIKEYAKKLPRLQEEKKHWEMHVKITQQINDTLGKREYRYFVEAQHAIIQGEDESAYLPFIEELISKQEPLHRVLRLICLACLVNNGIKTKTYDFLKREILSTYGYEVILTLNNLEKVGLFKREGRSVFPTIRKTLDLIHEDMDEKTIYDTHSVHGGYAPISVRLIEQAMQPNGWKSIKSALDVLPGPFRELDQQTIPGKKKIVMVFFIGGVTLAEASAIRYLNRKNTNIEYIIATTKLINGKTFLKSLYERVGPLARKK